MVDRELKFSLWLDFVERDYLKNEFSKLIEAGVINGATSNPSIFASAITTSPAYKEQLESLAGKSAKEKYEAMAIEDIRTAAQALQSAYKSGNDGYISIEVDPFLSNDTQGTIEEGKRLFEVIGEPNVMVKVPATNAGYEAMKELLSMGISVNATLIFSPEQARRCLKAMTAGLHNYEVYGGGKVNAVISVFVSRFDRLLDPDLAAEGMETGRTGIYNAARIYNIIEKNHTPSIRTLFASTGVKGDDLPADYYLRELLAPHSVNTAPLATIEAYIAKKATAPKLPIEESEINGYFTKLKDCGFDMEEVYASLLKDGLEAFENAFLDMLKSIE
ncbi:transaldolase [Sulfurovum lithotrophicum]|uniref:Transaldolase n=1 Tax=Sulfurovum lithotrophicum TaxID=206403 RepID=A0A7U4RQ21_9BACT|nr:transaldolase [Sulfurovum lithotrophicum]AKF24277.1 transaldolase [Sulfurovum lithotrophicum]